MKSKYILNNKSSTDNKRLDKDIEKSYVDISWKNHSVKIGKNFPVVIQSMTNTNTANIQATVNQIKSLVEAGSEIVRITVDNNQSAMAVPIIRNMLDAEGINNPLVGDFHFNGHKLLNDHLDCAKALSKYRINPGNIGSVKTKDENFSNIIKIAIKYNKPIRIGVNWGSLDKDILSTMMNKNNNKSKPLKPNDLMKKVMIASAIDSARYAESLGLSKNSIVISCKVSNVTDLVSIYKELSKKYEYPLHIGLTEAGIGNQGMISSTAALSILLSQNIGNTIRVSITNNPNEDRTLEVAIAKNILQALNLRFYFPIVISCPGCGRTNSTIFQELANNIQTYLKEKSQIWTKKYIGVENMKIAVMGCVVNGPGESKHANIGISLPGNGEIPVAPVFIDGTYHMTLKGINIYDEFIKIIHNYVEQKYESRI